MTKENLKKAAHVLAVLSTFFLIVIIQHQAPVISQGIRNGLNVCGNTVIPSLFCFMVLTNFMAATHWGEYCSLPLSPIAKYIFHVDSKTSAVIVMSFLGGYPIGAKAIADLVKNKQISIETANRLLSFCCNAAPSFVITAVGIGMFHNKKTGILLYCSQLLSGIIIALLTSFGKKYEPCSTSSKYHLPLSEAFVNAVNFSSIALFQMCGFILLFQAVVSIVQQTLHNCIAATFLLGFVEITTACLTMSQQTGSWVLPLLSFFLSFGGASVLFQILNLLRGTGINITRFLTFRVIHGMVSAGVCIILMKQFPQTVATVENFSAPLPVINGNTPFVTLCLVGMCSILLLNTKPYYARNHWHKY